jgi:hypothetical protein
MTHQTCFPFKVLVVLANALMLFACASENSSSSGGGGNSSGGGNSGTACTGNVTDCAPATLSSEQITTMCDTIATVTGDPAGTKYECKTGKNQGLFLGVNDRATCISTWPKAATCQITGRKLVDCYKAAKVDMCAALDGSCSFLLDETFAKACATSQ